jgi:hypothetical protein
MVAVTAMEQIRSSGPTSHTRPASASVQKSIVKIQFGIEMENDVSSRNPKRHITPTRTARSAA